MHMFDLSVELQWAIHVSKQRKTLQKHDTTCHTEALL